MFEHNVELLEEMTESSALDELVTIQDMMRWVYSYFNASDLYYGHGFDNPWGEAQQLVLCAVNLPLDVPEAMYASRLTRVEKERVLEIVAQRLGMRTPVAYLTNSAWFCGLEFYIDERVIVPRSPIGELIQKGFSGILKALPTRILDLCTGSGCIAIACAKRFSRAEVDAIDLSKEALDVAQINIERHDMTERVIPIESDLFDALPQDKYDLIVSNPPYVDEDDLSSMPKEFHFEPELALGSGWDGLDITKRILAQAADYLTDEGVLVCEVGNSMLQLIEQFPDVPFHWLDLKNGGIGVFTLNRQELMAHRHLFQ